MKKEPLLYSRDLFENYPLKYDLEKKFTVSISLKKRWHGVQFLYIMDECNELIINFQTWREFNIRKIYFHTNTNSNIMSFMGPVHISN